MSDPTVLGNREVIELLEAYLETARTQRFGGIAIAMVGHPNIAAVDFGGDIALELSLKEALGLANDKLDKSIASWTMPQQDPSLDASYVCYNLANGPLGFDFLIWLVDAEMARRREGALAPLKVGFWMGSDPEHVNKDNRRKWLENVFRPLITMIGAVEDVRAVYGHTTAAFVPRDIIAAVRNGEKVPHFASGWNIELPQAVTITLRESGHWPHRNSNTVAWMKFAAHLRSKGQPVVFIRDTQRAYEPLGDFITVPLASVDLVARQRYYEIAKANLFVGNGPVGLAMFGDRPWLQFAALEPDDSVYKPGTAKFWRENGGIEPGEQYPWCAPNQRIVWKADTYENIMSAWQKYIA